MILLQVLVGAAIVAYGSVLVVRGARCHSARSLVAGGALLLGAAVLAARMGTGVDKWNPTSVDDDALVGSWSADGSHLRFAADGTFRIDARGGAADRVRLTRSAGTWSRVDWNLTLRTAEGTVRELRIVVKDGEYRVIEQPGDLDGWIAWGGFRRTPPSVARPEPDPIR